METPNLDNNTLNFPKNPLLCPICHDYFTEPCILSCYHTFCARCLRGREQDRRLICPFCRQPTLLKDGTQLPTPDILMRQLIDIANTENPPCSNCDKRDRANMFYCNTCNQSLCSLCRDNTHRAKMFSTHDIVHMTRCTKEAKKCPQHGEHYIMFSTLQNTMLCVNCFRDLSNEARSHCLDIDTAHNQAMKRLERGQTNIMDLQTSVRDGIVALKNMMDELRRNMDSEKHTINTFCQGMQEAMAKTHAAMIMEVQRQFESKDRIYRSQLFVLGTVMPVLQLHLILCTTFTAAANKYQFLELSPSLIERLAAVGQLSQPVRSLQSSAIRTNYRSEFAQCLEPWIGPAAVSQHQSELAAASRLYDVPPPATKKQQTTLKNRMLEGESSFSSHCRSFESQIRELNQQFNLVKEKIGDLHRDINVLRKAQAPPITSRYELVRRDFQILEKNLDRQQQELDRMAANFDSSWEEQLWRLRIEQEVFSCQRADVMTLRNELKILNQLVSQLEPYVRSLTPVNDNQQSQETNNMTSILEQFGLLNNNPVGGVGCGGGGDGDEMKMTRSRSRVLGQLLEKVRPERERSKSAGQTDKPLQTPKIMKKTVQQMNLDRLEAHIKEKLHDIMCRRQSKSDGETINERKLGKTEQKLFLSKTDLDSIGKLGQTKKIMYKKIGKSCDKINTACQKMGETTDGKKHFESDYQRISEATTSVNIQNVKALIHSSPSSPKLKQKLIKPPPIIIGSKPQPKQQTQKKQPPPPPPPRKPKIYPYSDGEDNVFYSMNDSADSLSSQSSFDGDANANLVGPTDKTLVVVINKRNSKNMTLAQKQRSWETFPPKRRSHHHHHHHHQHICPSSGGTGGGGIDGTTTSGGTNIKKLSLTLPSSVPLRKADSFEGHEEAVKSLVAAVQETRRKPKGGN